MATDGKDAIAFANCDTDVAVRRSDDRTEERVLVDSHSSSLWLAVIAALAFGRETSRTDEASSGRDDKGVEIEQ